LYEELRALALDILSSAPVGGGAAAAAAAGFTPEALLRLSLPLEPLRAAGVELSPTGPYAALVDAAQRLAEGACPRALVEAGGVSLATLRAAGAGAPALLAAGLPPSLLLRQAFSAQELKEAGVSLAVLYEELGGAGIQNGDLAVLCEKLGGVDRRSNVQEPELRTAGAALEKLEGLGVRQMQAAGFTLEQMWNSLIKCKSHECSMDSILDKKSSACRLLLDAGVASIAELRALGANPPIIAHGYGDPSYLPHLGPAQLLAAGFSLMQLYLHGVPAKDLLASGVTLVELFQAGVPAVYLKPAGVTLAQLRSAGWKISRFQLDEWMAEDPFDWYEEEEEEEEEEDDDEEEEVGEDEEGEDE